MTSEEKQHWREMAGIAASAIAGKAHADNTVHRWEEGELIAQWDVLVNRCQAAVNRLHGETCIPCMYADVLAVLDADRRLKNISKIP